jgi:pimeloyl-ACP methyl ester carboxylesterase
MLAEVCSMQLYCLRLGRLIEEGRLTDTIAALAKMDNTRKARQVVAEARDLLGGNGILLDFHVMRHMADMEALHTYTYEGTETIQSSSWARTSRVSAPLPESAPSIRYVDVDGVRLRTSVRGAGSPLLLLTGIGAPLELSAPLERALNGHGVQTIALDAPGTGESSRYRRPRRMPGLARTVERTLDALGYDRVDVLGVSFGGVLGQQFAHQAPECVRRLVLAATGAGVAFLGGIRSLGGRARGVRGDDEPGPGVPQVVVDLPCLEQRVHRDHGRPGHQRPEVDDGEGRHVGQHESHAVAGRHAACGQRRRDPGSGTGEFAVGDDGVARPQGRPPSSIAVSIRCCAM